MKHVKITFEGYDLMVEEFNTIGEFVSFINQAPYNESYKNNDKSSDKPFKPSFHGPLSHSLSAAQDLLLHGWDRSIELNRKFKESLKDTSTKVQNFYDVCGFQVSVGRYLQGVPTSMVNQRKVVNHKKTVIINKNINYTAGVSATRIEQEAIKLFQLIDGIEKSGVRVNLNIFSFTKNIGYGSNSGVAGLKIRVKSASERLNLSKLAYPICHPSMLRRHEFAWFEKSTLIKHYDASYGNPLFSSEIIEIDGEYYLPSMITSDDALQFKNKVTN